MNILFASSEAHPLIKTGGLADVSGSLTRAILNQRQDIRLIIPAYRQVLKQDNRMELAAHLDLPGVDEPVRILGGRLPGSKVTLYHYHVGLGDHDAGRALDLGRVVV